MRRKISRSSGYTRRRNSLLPQEVVMDILSRLPVKPLLRFRCVCKSWNQLLRDPYFIQLHLYLHQSIKPNNNNHLNSDKQFLFLSIDDPFGQTVFHCALNYNACHKAMKLYLLRKNYYYYVVIGICNGLICLANLFGLNILEVYVWNPLIRDHITIPCLPRPSYIHHTMFGFGFLQSTNDYKLIRIILESECCSHVSVYTLGSTHSWRTLEPILYRLYLHTSPGAFVNEALHWLAATPTSSVSTDWNSILSFDLKDEVFQEIPQPNGFKDYYCSSDVELGELYGLLCMFCTLPYSDVHIWVMTEYGVVDSWTKHFKIRRLRVGNSYYSLQPLGAAKNGEIILRKGNSQLMLYNPKTNSTTSLKESMLYSHQVSAFVGSLVSPSSFYGTVHSTH